jgi:hypothetical protein
MMTTGSNATDLPGLPGMGMMAVLGAVFWFGFAMFVRILEPFGLLQGGAKVVMFVIAIPIVIALIAGIRVVMRYPAARMTEIIGIITAFAILLDGLSFAFYPTLYGNDPAHQIAGAGLILWGGGLGVLAALGIQMRAGR